MKLTAKFMAITFIGIMVCESADAADWGTNSKSEHTTNRMYQAIYGYVDMCQRYSSTEAFEIKAEAIKIIAAHPELIKALNESPYFGSAKRKMDEDIEGKAEFANPPCHDELSMLKQINNPKFQEEMVQAVNQWIADLKGR
jgi:hypothetical protein